MTIEALSVDGALDALKDTSSEAPDAVDPDDREESDNEVEDNADDSDIPTNDTEDNGAEESSDSDAEDDDAPEEASDEVDESEDKAEADKLPPIEPPQALDAKAREKFKALPREAQEILAEHDKALTADHTRKTQEVAAKRKEADARLERLKDVVLSKQEDRMAKWAKVDWKKLLAEKGNDEYQRNRLQFETERDEHEATKARVKQEEQAAYVSHIREQSTALAKLAPELAGEKGKARRMEIMSSVIKAGIDPERAGWITAVEMVWADKAMKWDAYQAERKTNPKTVVRKSEKTVGRDIRPANRSGAPSPKAAKVKDSFKQRPTQANAMRLLENMPD